MLGGARKLRVAVLAMDSFEDYDVKSHQKTYWQLYEAWFSKCPKVSATFENFEVASRLEFPSDLNQYDLFMITGSKYSAYEDLDWIHKAKEFVRRLDAEGRKVIGICFGHQLVAESLGGKVTRNPNGWEVGWVSFPMTEEAKAALEVADPRQTIDILYTHQDAVERMPPSFISLGGNNQTKVQGMAKNRQFVTFQGHPEFPSELLATIIERRQSRWTPEFIQKAQDSLVNRSNEVYCLERALDYLGLVPVQDSPQANIN